MTILAYVPVSRWLPRAVQSIHKLAYADMHVLFDPSGNDLAAHRFANITAKTERIRKLALDGGYEALLLLDDDMLFPVDTVQKLLACESPIAYGLTVWRNEPHWWSAALMLKEPAQHLQLNADPNAARWAWDKIIDVAGVGSYCTLVKRSALEALTFERRGPHNFDYYMACDAQRLGIQQSCHCGLIVGHYTALPTPRWMFPDPEAGENMVRVEVC